MVDKEARERVEKTNKFLDELGITDSSVRLGLLRLIHLATATSERPSLSQDGFWSGLIPFDYVTGPIKPTHRIHLYGPPSSGKSAIGLTVASNISKRLGAKVLLVDATYSVNKSYVSKLPGEFNIIQTTELNLLQSSPGQYNIIIIDDFSSVSDPEKIIQLMSSCGLTSTVLIICNQIRSDMRGGYYPSRPALASMCTMSLYVKRVEKREKYAVSKIQLERYRGLGMFEGRAMTIPIDYNGNILTTKAIETLLPLAQVYGEGIEGTDEDVVRKWVERQWLKT